MMPARYQITLWMLLAVAFPAASAAAEPAPKSEPAKPAEKPQPAKPAEQPDRADQEETFVVIKAGRVITMAGKELLGAEVVLVDGKVRLVGTDLEYPRSARVIDARREVVMPGMVLARTRWQLPSYSRSGVHGDRSVAREIYLDQLDLQPLVEAGFTAACFYPTGTGIPGPGAVYRTAGKKESRELGAAYLRITMANPGSDKKVLRGAVEKARKEIEKVEKARKDWEEKQKKAKEEAAKKKAEAEKQDPDQKDEADEKKDDQKEPPEKKDEKQGEKKEDAKPEQKKPEVFVPPKIDPAVQPLVDWIRDKKGPPLLYELSRASDLRHLEDVLKKASELPGELFYLARGYSADYHHVVADLGKRKAVVLLTPRMGTLPYTSTRYNLPGELALAGCTVVLLPSSDTSSAAGDVRVRLAELVRAGLSREDALKAVTLNAAKALGVADKLGSVEKGKQADLIFLDGDPLAAGTRVTRVMTCGEIVWEAPQSP